MNYRERLREDIKCPQFGDITYGRLGSLKYEDTKSIKRLLDEMDRADEIIKKQYFEIDKYKEILNKIKEELNNLYNADQSERNYKVFIEKVDKLLEEINERNI